MPKKYFEPEKLFEIDGVTESDKQLGWHYTLDEEQADPDMGTSHHFDVRSLPMFVQIPACNQTPADDESVRSWEMGHHAAVILAQLIADPSAIPLGEDWVP